MLLTEYNETETMALFKEEGFEEGLEKGITKATLKCIKSLMSTLKLSAKGAMDILEISDEDQKKYASQL